MCRPEMSGNCEETNCRNFFNLILMKPIEFSTPEKELLVDKIKNYFEAELNQDIGQFDAQLAIRSKLDDIESEIDSLEKPTDFVK